MERSEPVVDGSGELRIGAHPQLEDDVGDTQPMAVDQLAQPLQPLDLTRAVVPVTSRGAQGRDEPGLLEIPKHALRPAGGLGCLLDRQRMHPGKATTTVSSLRSGGLHTEAHGWSWRGCPLITDESSALVCGADA